MARNSSEHPLEERHAESSRIRGKYSNDDDAAMGGETAIEFVVGNLAENVRNNVLNLVTNLAQDPDFINEQIRVLDAQIQRLTTARDALIRLLGDVPSQRWGEPETSGSEPSV